MKMSHAAASNEAPKVLHPILAACMEGFTSIVSARWHFCRGRPRRMTRAMSRSRVRNCAALCPASGALSHNLNATRNHQAAILPCQKSVLQVFASRLGTALYLTDNPESNEHFTLCTGLQFDSHEDPNINNTWAMFCVAAMSKKSIAGFAAPCLQGVLRYLQRLVLWGGFADPAPPDAMLTCAPCLGMLLLLGSLQHSTKQLSGVNVTMLHRVGVSMHDAGKLLQSLVDVPCANHLHSTCRECDSSLSRQDS